MTDRDFLPVLERIATRCNENDNGCWIYTGGRNDAGYGVISINRRPHYAHRITYEGYITTIPDGLELDHLCRVRACCNPWHLEPVTHAVNMARGHFNNSYQARLTQCPAGHPYDKANTYLYPDGRHRACRACRRKHWAKQAAQRKRQRQLQREAVPA